MSGFDFNALLHQARRIGLRRIRFEVDLDAYVLGKTDAWVVNADGGATASAAIGGVALQALIERKRGAQ